MASKQNLVEPANSGSNGNRKASTFAAQSQLPRLPIPALEDTMTKFTASVSALLTAQEQKETQKIVQEFLSTDGPKLQQLLVQYEAEGVANKSFGSYVEEFWNDSYLAPDDSVVLNLNPYFILEKGPDRKTSHDQLHRAASLCFASLKMASMLKHETLPPDTFKGRPLCMDQFKVLFGSTRVPVGGGAGTKDYVHHYPDSTHVVVLIKNHIYYFQALWPGTFNVAVDQHDVKEILEAIERHADYLQDGKTTASQKTTSNNNNINGHNKKQNSNGTTKSNRNANASHHQQEYDNHDMVDANGKTVSFVACDESLGVLTSLPRREWAAARKMINEEGNAKNQAALKLIDSALFALVLDDHAPENVNQSAANMLHGSHKLIKGPNNELMQVGSCCNRWYDKLQLIVMANGEAGVNFEHSSIDGHSALRYVSDIFAENVIQFAQSITALIYGKGWIPDNMQATVNRAHTTMSDMCNRAPHEEHRMLDVFPKKIEFDLSPKVKELIRYAETNLADQINSSDLEVLEFHAYGKLLIVKNNMSPDSFVQMCIMLAYYRLYGKFVCSYEPVLTKAFYHGRTEAMRGATPQAKKLCETWCNEMATKGEKLEALLVATKEHSRLVRECANGKGVDRHLFALKCMAERNSMSMPTFFRSKAWQALNHTVLSTSNCGNPSLRLFGFGPVVQDGFGIGYIIKDHGVQFSISSKHRQTLRLANSLENTMMDLKRLMSTSSSVVCHGEHHNHIIHPPPAVARGDDASADYADFWGESVLNSTASNPNVDKEVNGGTDEEKRDSGSFFTNIVRKDSLSLAEMRTKFKELHFNESIRSMSSTDSNNVTDSDAQDSL